MVDEKDIDIREEIINERNEISMTFLRKKGESSTNISMNELK